MMSQPVSIFTLRLTYYALQSLKKYAHANSMSVNALINALVGAFIEANCDNSSHELMDKNVNLTEPSPENTPRG